MDADRGQRGARPGPGPTPELVRQVLAELAAMGPGLAPYARWLGHRLLGDPWDGPPPGYHVGAGLVPETAPAPPGCKPKNGGAGRG